MIAWGIAQSTVHIPSSAAHYLALSTLHLFRYIINWTVLLLYYHWCEYHVNVHVDSTTFCGLCIDHLCKILSVNVLLVVTIVQCLRIDWVRKQLKQKLKKKNFGSWSHCKVFITCHLLLYLLICNQFFHMLCINTNDQHISLNTSNKHIELTLK